MTENLTALQRKRAAQAVRRANAIAAGLCITCCKRPHAANVTKCESCGGKDRTEPRAWTRQADKFCIECQAHAFHRSDCKRAA